MRSDFPFIDDVKKGERYWAVVLYVFWVVVFWTCIYVCGHVFLLCMYMTPLSMASFIYGIHF